jgi:hypothetical protein
MTRHELRSWVQFFEPINAGDRTHELRRNDRAFAVGDTLLLREFDAASGKYTGRSLQALVTAMTSDELPCAVSDVGLTPGFCILSIRVVSGS